MTADDTQSRSGGVLACGLRLHCAPRSNYVQRDLNPAEITRLIEDGLPDATVRVMSDDNTHFEALVVAAAFSGKRLLARHQMVYKCLGSLVGNEIHALSIIAMTPEEWREKGVLE